MAQPPLPVQLPPPPNDPHVPLPAAAVYPPTRNNVEDGIQYRHRVKISSKERPAGLKCTPEDNHNAILYEHNIIAQAAIAAAPANMPPWVQQLRADIRADLAPLRMDIKRLLNRKRDDGHVIAFDIVPFQDGSDPTQPPHGLPPLRSFTTIEGLDGSTIVTYLQNYGVPVPGGPNNNATNRLRKDALKVTVAGTC